MVLTTSLLGTTLQAVLLPHRPTSLDSRNEYFARPLSSEVTHTAPNSIDRPRAKRHTLNRPEDIEILFHLLERKIFYIRHPSAITMATTCSLPVYYNLYRKAYQMQRLTKTMLARSSYYSS